MNVLLSQIFAQFRPALLLTAGITIYAIFVLHFYRFLSQTELFEVNFDKYATDANPSYGKWKKYSLYLIKYVLVFPIFTFLWLTFLTLVLILLSSQDISTVLLIATSVLVAVRATAYYDADLGRDLAKMLPFALLGAFIVKLSSFSLASSLEKIFELPTHWQTILTYLLFALVIELILRLIKKIQD